MTGQIVFSKALTTLGLLEQGGQPSVSDSNDGMDELNDMWATWGLDEGLIYAVIPFRGVLVANQGAYNIGSGAQFDTQRPARIYEAVLVTAKSFTGGTTEDSATVTAGSTTGLYIGNNVIGPGIPQGAVILSVIANTSITLSDMATATGSVTLYAGGNDRTQLDIIEAGRYYKKNDLGATAQTPQELYPDFNVNADGFARLYIWPVPLVLNPMWLELADAVNFTTWTLTDDYQIPQGFADMLNYCLAARLITRYGHAVDETIAARVEQRALKAEQVIRNMNRVNRQLTPEQAGLATQPAEK